MGRLRLIDGGQRRGPGDTVEPPGDPVVPSNDDLGDDLNTVVAGQAPDFENTVLQSARVFDESVVEDKQVLQSGRIFDENAVEDALDRLEQSSFDQLGDLDDVLVSSPHPSRRSTTASYGEAPRSITPPPLRQTPPPSYAQPHTPRPDAAPPQRHAPPPGYSSSPHYAPTILSPPVGYASASGAPQPSVGGGYPPVPQPMPIAPRRGSSRLVLGIVAFVGVMAGGLGLGWVFFGKSESTPPAVSGQPEQSQATSTPSATQPAKHGGTTIAMTAAATGSGTPAATGTATASTPAATGSSSASAPAATGSASTIAPASTQAATGSATAHDDLKPASSSAEIASLDHPVLEQLSSSVRGQVAAAVPSGHEVTVGEKLFTIRYKQPGGARTAALVKRIAELEPLAKEDPAVYEPFLSRARRDLERAQQQIDVSIIKASAAGLVASHIKVGDEVKPGAILGTVVDGRRWVAIATVPSNEPNAAWTCAVSTANAEHSVACKIQVTEAVKDAAGGTRVTAEISAAATGWLDGVQHARLILEPPSR